VPVNSAQIITVSPWDNIQDKLNNLKPWDTLQFHKWIYYWNYYIKNSWTKNAWIKITNFPWEKPVFKPKSWKRWSIFHHEKGKLSYFQINWLSFDNPNWPWIDFYRTTGNYVIISNNEVVNLGANWINNGNMHAIDFQTNASNPQSNNILIYWNYIHDNHTRWAKWTWGWWWDNEALSIIWNIKNFTMESNRVVNNSFIGMDVIWHRKWMYAWAGMNTKWLIVNNYVAWNWKLHKYSNWIYIDWWENLLIEKNTSINNTTWITIAQEWEWAIGKNIIARYNYIENSILHDIWIWWNNHASTIVHDVTFKNNVIKETWFPDDSMILLMSGYNNKFIDNLFIGWENRSARHDQYWKWDKKSTWELKNNIFTSNSTLNNVKSKFWNVSWNKVWNNESLKNKVWADESRIPKWSKWWYIWASAQISNFIYWDNPIILTVYENYWFQVNNSWLILNNSWTVSIPQSNNPSTNSKKTRVITPTPSLGTTWSWLYVSGQLW
jgi:hypothetical protein